MAKIKILSQEVASRVAAGEVVTRPLNVVKELVENAVDAGSRSITVELLNGGKRRICVIDDGPGMSRENLLLCVESHATSKLQDINDFNTLRSFGFRGEALHSIAAVSRLRIESRCQQMEHGYSLELYGGRQQEIQVSPIAKGTRVLVRDLFFNIPARLKFLKSDNYEKELIVELLQSFVLVHPSISFRILHNDREILFSSGQNNEAEILSLVFKNEAPNLIALPDSVHNILRCRVHGFLSPPISNRPTRGDFRIFVNNRIIRYPALYKAVRAVYGEINGQKHFSGLLFIDIDPHLLDVNIHPQKTEIRLDNELIICELVQNAVKKALLTSDLITIVKTPPEEMLISTAKATDVQDDVGLGFFLSTCGSTVNLGLKEKAPAQEGKAPAQEEKAPAQEVKGIFAFNREIPQNVKTTVTLNREVPQNVKDTVTLNREVPQDKKKAIALNRFSNQSVEMKAGLGALTNYRIVGQFANSFIIVEQRNRLLLIDQHVAQETILFTDIYQRLLNPVHGFSTQNLLKPLPLSLSAFYRALLSEHEELLKRVGFRFQKKAADYLLQGLPSSLGSGFDEVFFLQLLNRLADCPSGNVLENKYRELAAMMACKGSIKAGMQLSPPECEELVKKLAMTENPFFCPHGRPVIIAFALTDILKRFGRNPTANIFGNVE